MLKTLAFLCIFALSSLTLPALAQNFDYRSIISQGTTTTISLESEFEQRHERQLALHFTLDVPSDSEKMQLQSNFKQADRLGSIRFLTIDGRIAETVDMFSGTIPAGPHETREESLASLLQNQVVPNLGTFEDLNVLGARRMMVGTYSAIEVVALYASEGNGQIGLRVVGVFPPAGENILIFVSHTVLDVVAILGVNDLPSTLAGQTLQSVHFSGTRALNGMLESL